MMTLGEKGNILGNIFLPWVIHICDVVNLGGMDNVLGTGKSFSTPMYSALDL
jgi:hypothetical protein